MRRGEEKKAFTTKAPRHQANTKREFATELTEKQILTTRTSRREEEGFSREEREERDKESLTRRHQATEKKRLTAKGGYRAS